MTRSALLVPLVIVALLAGAVGFLATRALQPQTQRAAVSVVALPSTPTPEPTESPSPSATTRVRVRTRDGEVTGGRPCPAGCTCDQHPNGIVIRCTGG